jgi:hypothetical protein
MENLTLKRLSSYLDTKLDKRFQKSIKKMNKFYKQSDFHNIVEGLLKHISIIEVSTRDFSYIDGEEIKHGNTTTYHYPLEVVPSKHFSLAYIKKRVYRDLEKLFVQKFKSLPFKDVEVSDITDTRSLIPHVLYIREGFDTYKIVVHPETSANIRDSLTHTQFWSDTIFGLEIIREYYMPKNEMWILPPERIHLYMSGSDIERSVKPITGNHKYDIFINVSEPMLRQGDDIQILRIKQKSNKGVRMNATQNEEQTIIDILNKTIRLADTLREQLKGQDKFMINSTIDGMINGVAKEIMETFNIEPSYTELRRPRFRGE